MSIQKNVTEVFIGGGAALDAATTAMPLTKQLGIVGPDMLVPSLSASTIALAPSLYIVNKLTNGTYKRSNPIKGTSVVGYKGRAYVPSRRNVWSIGYHRAFTTNNDIIGTSRAFTAAAGSIEVNSSTEYTFSIRFKNDKSFYAERPETLRVTFTSAATATQLTIATQIAAAINGSAFGSSVSGVKEIIAVVVADGSGAYGLTSATNYGVEITGLTINQFQTTQYAEELVFFSCHVDDASGFGATTQTEIQGGSRGNGTYNQIYNLENKYYGTLNNTTWPIPAKNYLSSSTLVASADVVGASNQPTGALSAASTGVLGANTVGYDVVEVASATSGLRPGESITINSVTYEIKYLLSATKFVLTSPITATVAAQTLKVNYGYNIITITVQDVTTQDGSGVGQLSTKNIVIATPAIDAGDTDPFLATAPAANNASAECVDVVACLNAWMTTTPLAPAALVLAQRF